MGYINPADSIPTKQSNDGDWIAWYESLPGGKRDKNLIFSMAWNKRGDSKANTGDLRRFLKTKGFTLNSDNFLGTAKDSVIGFIDGVGNFFQFGAYATVGVIIAGTVLTGAIIWRLATPAGIGVAAGTAAKVYTGGAGNGAAAAAGALK